MDPEERSLHPPPVDDDSTRWFPEGSAATGPPPTLGGAEAHAHALPPGTRLHEFEISALVGEGGFGIVYLAFDHSLGREVAIKEYMPSSMATRHDGLTVSVRSARHADTFQAGLRSFVNEARMLAHFDHPSLLKVHRFWEAHGTAYMAMPYYRGQTLKARLQQTTAPPSEAWLRTLLAQLLDALQVLHSENCFHRDIAPDNILLLADDRPVLLDFGAARQVIGDMTQDLTVILKPGYAPIEQYAESPTLKQGPWTDIHALAAVLYFAMFGKTPPAAVSRMVDDRLAPASGLGEGRYSAGLLNAVDHALRLLPGERTQDVAAFRAQLDVTAGALPGPAQRARGVATADSAPPDASTDTSTDDVTLLRAPPVPSPLPPVIAAGVAAPGTSHAQGAEPTPPKRRRIALGALGLAALAVVGVAWRGATQPSAEDTRTTAPAPAPPTAVAANHPEAEPASPRATPEQPPTDAAVTPAPSPPPTPAPPPDSSAAEATAPAPAPPSDLFDRLLAQQTPGFSVIAAAARPRLRINRDRLSFTVTSAQPGHVHVLLREPSGTLLLLFPNTLSSRNAIRAGTPLVLPQAQWPLMALAPAGRQRFLVIVTQQAHDFSALKRAQQGPFAQLDDTLGGTPQPGGAPLPGRAGCDAAACQHYGAAGFEVDIVP